MINDKCLNKECMKCPVKLGCLILCAFHPNDVMKPPCEKYAIGISQTDSVFWTRPADKYLEDPDNPAPTDLKFCIV